MIEIARANVYESHVQLQKAFNGAAALELAKRRQARRRLYLPRYHFTAKYVILWYSYSIALLCVRFVEYQ